MRQECSLGTGHAIAWLAAVAIAAGAAGARGDDEAPRSPVADGETSIPSPAQQMAAHGLIRYRGMWRTTQEIELIERGERVALAQKEWATRLERLRKRIDDPRQGDAAAEEIREIADPSAVPALAAALAEERSPRLRAWYVDSLSHIRSPDATAALLAAAVDHPDPETRILAIEKLAADAPTTAAAALVPLLSGDDNARINRVAEAIGRLGAADAVGPLIAALETEHVVVVGGGAPPGSTTATFTPAGGGLSMGNGPKRQKTRTRNQQVLEALVRITGVNFEWNLSGWRAWFSSRQGSSDIDLRRG